MVSHKIYRQQLEELGVEDINIDSSSFTEAMKTLNQLQVLKGALKKLRHNIRADIRGLRMEHMEKIREIEDPSKTSGLFGRKLSKKEKIKRRKALIKERDRDIVAYEILETEIDNYLTQIDDAETHIRNFIQMRVR